MLIIERCSITGEVMAVAGFADSAGVSERGDPLIERGGADAATAAQLGERQRLAGFGQCTNDLPVARNRRRVGQVRS